MPGQLIVYSPKYGIDIGEHVFPTSKYHLVRDLLIEEFELKIKDFIEPEPARDEDILLVHTPEYVKKLTTGALSQREEMTLELPYSKELAAVSWLCAGGTILASHLALKEGRAFHIGGGFHHAFPDHGEGFCVLNDIAIGVMSLRKEKLINKAMVVDCDLHQGNGTAAIFKDNKDVFTFSIHQLNNYPFVKPPSDLDIELLDGTGDKEYLGRLEKGLKGIIPEFKPSLIVYLAGADPYVHDQLGGLALTMEGLRERDRLVFGICKRYSIPCASVLGGGYAVRLEDTVRIHYNMIVEGWKGNKGE